VDQQRRSTEESSLKKLITIHSPAFQRQN